MSEPGSDGISYRLCSHICDATVSLDFLNKSTICIRAIKV